ncbi:MAG: ABC transporter ATP-binding protein [Lentisphaerae bacterium]|nr:ABC transporter ATP-binding protein [Lentisphaerota bacterium]
MQEQQPLLEVRNLRVHFPVRRGVFARVRGCIRAVDGVSLRIAAGETVGLVGESGCGKSTFARAILRLDPATDGHVLFGGRDLLSMPHDELRRARPDIQMVFQDPFSSLNPRLTVLDTLTEGLVEHRRIPHRERRDAALGLLRDVGLPDEALLRYPHEFSGGQRQRIGIARALSLRPRLLVCDEPVSALDVSVQAQILNLLSDLRRKYGLSYLFISHDLGVVRHLSQRVAVMYLGRIIELGPASAVLTAPAHPYTRALLAAVPVAGAPRRGRRALAGQVPSPAAIPEGCRFHPRCPFASDACRAAEPELTPCGSAQNHTAACIRIAELPPFNA